MTLNFDENLPKKLINTLINFGVHNFFVAPGFRNSILIKNLVHNKQCHIHYAIDERSLGFSALGFAKRSKKIAVIIVTSGTAVANLLPSIVESFHSNIKLLIITADRPKDYLHRGCNQTIRQKNIFTNFVYKSFVLCDEKSSQEIEDILSESIKAKRSVHINIHIRDNKFEKHLLPTVKCGAIPNQFWQIKNGLICVGELHDKKILENILLLSKTLHWPIYASVLSGLKFTNSRQICQELILKINLGIFDEKIDAVLFFGDQIVSKNFWQCINALKHKNIFRVYEDERIFDPSGNISHVKVDTVNNYLQVLNKELPKNLLACLNRPSNETLLNKFDSFISSTKDYEGYWAHWLIKNISVDCNLLVGASMPIRYLDLLTIKKDCVINIFSNRGASGIDGIVSTAVGIYLAEKIPTVLLIGDVSFIHDLNSLYTAKKNNANILIIVLNNNGGGIFEYLPIKNFDNVINPYIKTPHKVCFDSVCYAFDVPYYLVSEKEDLLSHVQGYFNKPSLKMIEIKCDSKKSMQAFEQFKKQLSY